MLDEEIAEFTKEEGRCWKCKEIGFHHCVPMMAFEETRKIYGIPAPGEDEIPVILMKSCKARLSGIDY